MSDLKRRAVVAMSGGVDSTVAAWLARQAGWEITGVHLNSGIGNGGADDPALQESCRRLGIPLVERECADEFLERVLRPGAAEYQRARTPNPCCECNKLWKFHELFSAADALGIETVFTGHYAALRRGEDGLFRLGRAADGAKDQSYFLYRLTQADLSRVGFPLGSLTKPEVRRIAAEAALPCAGRPDSQDACFQLPGECCGDTLSRLCRLPGKAGNFTFQGRIVGRHTGLHRYTLGQRQGLGVALGVPAYVKRIDAGTGEIELCTDQDELLSRSFTVNRLTWQSGSAPQSGRSLKVRVRYRSPGAEAELSFPPGETEQAIVTLKVPQRAVTPGQAAVFYDGDDLLGGGVIDRVFPLH